jgi:hypothetical protein
MTASPNPGMAKADRVLRKSYGLTSKRQQIKSAGFRRPPDQHSCNAAKCQEIRRRQSPCLGLGRRYAASVMMSLKS